MLVSSCLSHKLVTCLFATATATTTSSSTPTTYTTTSATANHHHHQHYHHDLYTTSTTCSVNIRQSPRVSAAARVSCVLPLIRMHSTQHCGEAFKRSSKQPSQHNHLLLQGLNSHHGAVLQCGVRVASCLGLGVRYNPPQPVVSGKQTTKPMFQARDVPVNAAVSSNVHFQLLFRFLTPLPGFGFI